ncbi:F-box/LRR-repeat protein 20-like isoform X2 [Bacillus rossius redtenbacheri]
MEVSLNDFPDEVLVEILRHLPAEELAGAARRVCRRWGALCRDRTVWEGKSFACDRLTERSVILDVLETASTLRLFEVHSRDDARDLVTRLCASCKGFSMLHVMSCNLGTNTHWLLEDVARSSRDLLVLNLKGSYALTEAAFMTIVGFKKLYSLNLSYCKGLTGYALREIVNGCRCLKELCIDDIVKIYDSDIIYVIDKQYDLLDILHLDGEDLTDASFVALSKCTGLTDLQISFCDHMTDQGLLNGIGKLTKLSVLKLRKGVQLTSPGLLKFFKSDNFSSLMYLDMSECSSLDDSTMLAIGTSARNLWVLILHWCWEVTDDGVHFIVTNCRHLRKLDLLGLARISVGACPRDCVAGAGALRAAGAHLPEPGAVPQHLRPGRDDPRGSHARPARDRLLRRQCGRQPRPQLTPPRGHGCARTCRPSANCNHLHDIMMFLMDHVI